MRTCARLECINSATFQRVCLAQCVALACGRFHGHMTAPMISAAVTEAFEAHAADPATFNHVEHVHVAFDLLRKYDFIDAAEIYAKGIRAIAAKAGASGKFNLTITYAFMSLIAERLTRRPAEDFDLFASANADLMSKDILSRWYRIERLNSDTARTVFLLPDAA